MSKRKIEEKEEKINKKIELGMFGVIEKHDVEGLKKEVKENQKFVTLKDEDQRTALHVAIEKGYLDMVEVLLKGGAEINAQTKQGYSPLFLATKNGNIEAINFLLSKDANPNVQDGQLNSPLHYAAENEKQDIAIILLRAKNGFLIFPLYWLLYLSSFFNCFLSSFLLFFFFFLY